VRPQIVDIIQRETALAATPRKLKNAREGNDE
jgi:hypothetical protein